MIQSAAQKSLTSSKVFIEVFMQFDASIHTKEFLRSNPDVVLNLAKESAEFAISDLAKDFEVLSLAYENGKTVAHELAYSQVEWATSDMTQKMHILQLADNSGWCVAHDLALFQPEWAKSKAANSFEVLCLSDIYGESTAHFLAEHQPEWAKSEASQCIEVLRLANKNNLTVAHRLADRQPEWAKSEAAQNFEVIKLNTKNGKTVAHWLAKMQPEWCESKAAQSLDILMMASSDGITVAHWLAQHQDSWLYSEAVKKQEIMSMNSSYGSVARFLVLKNKNCINHEPLMQKQILTLEHDDKLIAQEISSMYFLKGFDLPVMAMKLISQGAAYKHSLIIELAAGEEILNQCKLLLDDNLDPLISFKQLQGLYSTFSYNVTKIISNDEQEQRLEWQGLLLQSENLNRQHLDKHPELLDIDHTIDIFCEPGDDLLKRLMTERILKDDLSQIQDSIYSAETESIKQGIY